MTTESSEIEEILQLGSFEKGLRAELRSRMRSERNKLLALAGVFAFGVVIGFLVTRGKD
jgi:hypothetical protein